MLCRPDLIRKTWVGALLFLTYYLLFLLGLESTAPGYIERVWNVQALSGVRVLGIPLEELLFAAAFGERLRALQLARRLQTVKRATATHVRSQIKSIRSSVATRPEYSIRLFVLLVQAIVDKPCPLK